MMGDDQPKASDEIVEHLAGLDDAERAAWLDEHVDDPAVRARVEAGLAEVDALADDEEVGLADVLASNDVAEAPREIGGYEIRAQLGRGGMGIVYLAHDPRLDRIVAIKRIYDEAARRRFTVEAMAVARLDHPGIVPVYQFEPSGPEPFLVMEYVPGESLESRLALERSRDVDRAQIERQRFYADLIARTAEALHHAHERGVVHRDVKPANIIVDLDGRPRLTDFGVAKIADRAALGLTRGGERPGTLRYMSPEQASLERSAGIDRRSDVFSLGVVLYECLTLAPAFTGRTAEQVLRAVAEHEPARLRERVRGIDGDLEAIVDKAIAKRRERRYQSAAAMAAELDAWMRGDVVHAPRSSWPRRMWARIRRARGGIVAAAVVVAVLAVGMAVERRLSAPRASLVLEAFTNTSRDPGEGVDVVVEELPILGVDAPRDSRRVALGWRRARTVDVEPGRYRVAANGPDGWSAEAIVVLEDGQTTPLRLCIVDGTDAERDGMVFVAASGGRPAFWIDRDEVSNARYAAFLAELAPDDARRLRPTWWPADGPPADLADRPVVGVSLEAATCFAAWDGKRLPTAEEWERAVRGDDGRAVPWGGRADVDPACFANCRTGAFGNVVLDVTRHTPDAPGHADLLADLAASLQPVSSPQPAEPCDDNADGALRDVTPSGIRHLFGNVMEWTVSPSQQMWLTDGETLEFALKGRAWRDMRPGAVILGGASAVGDVPGRLATGSGQAPSARLAGIGFRCVRTAGPRG